MAGELIAKFGRDLLLKLFDKLRRKFDNISSVDVDEVIVMVCRGVLIARPCAIECVTVHNATIFQHLDCAIDCGEGNPGLDFSYPAVQLLRIGMVAGFRHHLKNRTPLRGQSQPGLLQALFKIINFGW